MKTKSILFLLMLAAAFLSARCTIEKRLYQKGYHIEWNKKASLNDKPEKISETRLIPDENTGESTSDESTRHAVPEQHSSAPGLISTEQVVIPESVSENTGATTEIPSLRDQPQVSASSQPEIKQAETKQAHQTDTAPEKDSKTFEPVGIASFSIYFAALILGTFALIAINPVAILSFTALLLILSLILGIVSVVRSRRHKDLYRRNFFGYFGLIASSSTLIIGIIALLLLAISFLFLSSWS